jgi:hypothetical protein
MYRGENMFGSYDGNPLRGIINEGYDTMQVCNEGHLITAFAKTQPEGMKERCNKCGSETITACPECSTDIQGHFHVHGVFSLESTPIPDYCHKCGKPYPWKSNTASKVQNADKSAVGESKRMNLDIFIVHGHDEEMKQSVARVLSILGLKPIILHEQPNEGKTIIEKFEKNSNVGFAVILLSPDDFAYSVKSTDPEKDRKHQARQNVILELGYFVGNLGRSKVFSLKRDSVELPSDFHGVVYTS